MITDHIGAAFPETFGLEFRVVGRLAFPIYVFLIAEGFFHTKNAAKFLLRLFVFAIISEPFFDMALNGAGIADVNFIADTNIFYTLFLGGAAIAVYQKFRDKISFVLLAFVPLVLFMWLADTVFDSDYGAYGVFFIFAMYWLRRQAQSAAVSLVFFALLCLWQYADFVPLTREYGFGVLPVQFWLMIPATLLTVVPVALYNGKRGPGGAFMKWFFYASYPVHLAILGVLRLTF